MAVLRVPWFAAAAQRRREPALAEQPLVLGAPRRGAWRVVALSAEAAAAGVRVDMPLAQAESLCPTLVRRPFDPGYLAREHERLLAALEAHVAVELGEAGWALFVPPAGGVTERLRLGRLVDALAVVTGYWGAVGVADGRGAATIAARRATAGKVEQVPPGAVAAYLAPLPTTLLPVPAEMRQRLGLFGLHTIGALATLPLGAVQAQFGPAGRLAWELARGRDARPLAPRTPPCLPSAELWLDAPCVDRAPLLAALPDLVARALRDLPPGQVVGSLQLNVELEQGTAPGPATWEQALALHQPTAEPAALRATLETALLRVTLPAPALGLRLTLADVGPATPLQPGLFADRRAVHLALAAAARRLRARFGTNPLQRVVALDPRHRLPERRYALVEAG